MLTRWVYSIYTSFNILAELVAQIFPFVELVDLKLVLLCHFLYNVVIICMEWLFFGQVVIFCVQVVIFWTGGYFLDRWLFFCTEGLCVYNAHSYFGYFAQMKYNER